jgi:hypothetical protein
MAITLRRPQPKRRVGVGGIVGRTLLPTDLDALVAQAFLAQVRKKVWTTKFEQARDQATDALNRADYFDRSRKLVTIHGSITIQERENATADLALLLAAIERGELQAVDVLRVATRFDTKALRQRCGQQYVISAPTDFYVFRASGDVSPDPEEDGTIQ